MSEQSSMFMRYFGDRFHGRTPLIRVFWRDMVLIGSSINILLVIAAVTYLANGGTSWIGAIIFLAALPYNLFIVDAVWRAARNDPSPEARWARWAAIIWLIVFVLI